MKISKTLSVLLLLTFILSACTFPTKVPKAPATAMPTTTVTATSTVTEASPALPDYSSSVYLDDRSTPAALVLSYINAINSHHFVRAYSYWVGPDPILGSLADFTHFVEGIESETVSLGAVTTEGAAGSIYYTLPAALTVHLSGGGTDKYSACFVIRLPQPGNYGAPPIQPMHFTSNTTILAADAGLSDEQILAMTCSASEGLPVEPAVLEGLDDISSANYIDNRSDPVAVVKSLLNAINSLHYVRAYSYFESPDFYPGAFDTYQAGLGDIKEITSAQFGVPSSEGAAGNFYYQVAVAEFVTHTDDTEHLYIGCYSLHLANPAIQGTLPFRPMTIIAGAFTEYSLDADVLVLLTTACNPPPTVTPTPTFTPTPITKKTDPCKKYTQRECEVHKDTCVWTGSVCKSR